MFLSNSPSVAPFADFEQKFCARLRVAPDRFREIVFRRTLYPHARLLRPLLQFFAPDFFEADHDFLMGVGRLWRRRDFRIEVWDFFYHPSNRGFLRRQLRLRVSVERTQKLVESLLGEAPSDEVAFLSVPTADAARQG